MQLTICSPRACFDFHIDFLQIMKTSWAEKKLAHNFLCELYTIPLSALRRWDRYDLGDTGWSKGLPSRLVPNILGHGWCINAPVLFPGMLSGVLNHILKGSGSLKESLKQGFTITWASEQRPSGQTCMESEWERAQQGRDLRSYVPLPWPTGGPLEHKLYHRVVPVLWRRVSLLGPHIHQSWAMGYSHQPRTVLQRKGGVARYNIFIC